MRDHRRFRQRQRRKDRELVDDAVGRLVDRVRIELLHAETMLGKPPSQQSICDLVQAHIQVIALEQSLGQIRPELPD